jgi:Spy/CpxP family protein refolding chaperone
MGLCPRTGRKIFIHMILVGYVSSSLFGMAIAFHDSQKQTSRGGLEMKRLITVLGVVFLIGAFAMPAVAHGPGYGKGPGTGPGWGPGAKGNWGGGPGYCWDEGRATGNLSSEQGDKLNALYRKFHDDTAQVRSDLWNKSGELNRLFNSENPDAEKVKALQKEISDLRAKMAQARIDLELEERKIAPEGTYGRGMRGYGPGMRGYGPGMRGYGPGMRSKGPGMRGYGPGMRGYGPGTGGYGRHMMGGYGPGYYGHHMGGYGRGMMGPGWHHRGRYGPEACWR